MNRKCTGVATASTNSVTAQSGECGVIQEQERPAAHRGTQTARSTSRVRPCARRQLATTAVSPHPPTTIVVTPMVVRTAEMLAGCRERTGLLLLDLRDDGRERDHGRALVDPHRPDALRGPADPADVGGGDL